MKVRMKRLPTKPCLDQYTITAHEVLD